MPTKRVWIFLTLALLLYFLANQTQVGWLYIITDGLVAIVIASFFYARGLLKPVRATRRWRKISTESLEGEGSHDGDLDRQRGVALTLPTFHEEDLVEVTLQFQNAGIRPILLVSGQESCPFAPSGERQHSFFIPLLTKRQPVRVSYRTRCDRRGFHTFPPLPLRSRGAFGLFSSRRTLPVPGGLLIYPAYYPLQRLRTFEKIELAEKQTVKVGPGSEIIGTREYRSGDSLRHIHWRSTARAGKLVVKEFSDDEQTNLTVALDLASTSNLGSGKFSTFETAVRIAASLGYYAHKKSIPFYLVGDSRSAGRPQRKLDLPPTPLSWWTVLNYLAKVQNRGQKPLARVLADLTAAAFVIVLISNPDEATTRAAEALSRRGIQTLAIFITPDGAVHPAASRLGGNNLEIKHVSPYNWPGVLSE